MADRVAWWSARRNRREGDLKEPKEQMSGRGAEVYAETYGVRRWTDAYHELLGLGYWGARKRFLSFRGHLEREVH